MIQQKVEPDYNPRRLLRMVMMDMREAAFESPTTWLCSACDLCYPACPQEIHISSVIGAIKQLAVEAGHNKPDSLETVSVDEDACSGCGICVLACPYEAPHLVEKEVNGVMDRVSEVEVRRHTEHGRERKQQLLHAIDTLIDLSLAPTTRHNGASLYEPSARP